ncbi:MSC_0618 family F1-like ATPase beta subunit [[Mycoplasma] gypis]|uniref:F0F1 ATP synthase subunit beta n=1 Tax=[Mycoplasma] gypis TaxID=92404 RepID=A0ABZ2RMN4_9BACT|nr:F0F1 ATP synthase subunit beta [[Mycoplasma] gypis]MBN0919022.1 F0F1 ATP synthase subunit beta [[Mycoplasma] gypis]
MSCKITKIWTDVIEVAFENEEVAKVNTILASENQNSILLVKKITDFNSVYAMVIKTDEELFVNQKLVNTNKTFVVPVGQKAKNNIYNIMGESLTNPKNNSEKVEMNSTIQTNNNFNWENKVLETGIKAIDFFIPIIQGSKIGIFGGAGVGKTVLMKEIIFNLSKSQEKTSSIFIGSGERSREGVELYKDLQDSDLMKNSTMYISQMNESAGSRMNIVPVGLTAAEYLRDQEKENVLLFIDNIFRFLQAGNEISASMDKKPSIGGYQSTLNTDISLIENRIFANENGSITSFQTVFLPMDDFSDPSAVATFKHLGGSLVLSRDIAAKNIYPAFDPLASTSASVDPNIIGSKHYEAIIETKRILQRYKELEDIILILGFDELDKASKEVVKKALQLQNFFSQTFSMAQNFTQRSSVFVKVEDTVDSVKRIIDGEFLDHDPEEFMYIGSVNDLITK